MRVVNVLTGVCGLVMAWGVLSWVDVVMHNLNPNPVYQAWNLFAIFF